MEPSSYRKHFIQKVYRHQNAQRPLHSTNLWYQRRNGDSLITFVAFSLTFDLNLFKIVSSKHLGLKLWVPLTEQYLKTGKRIWTCILRLGKTNRMMYVIIYARKLCGFTHIAPLPCSP